MYEYILATIAQNLQKARRTANFSQEGLATKFAGTWTILNHDLMVEQMTPTISRRFAENVI